VARDLTPRARLESLARRTPAAVAALLFVAALAGCGAAADAAGSPATSTAAPTVGTTPEPRPTNPPASKLVPDGTAADNLPLFSDVTTAVWGSDARVAGRAYVDALAAAGFDKAAMQVTHDRSTVGNAAESIQFSVRWGDKCLVGQVGPATGEPVTVIVPALAEGTCLIGDTRPIDW
jgi:hypothetical protein